MDPEESEGCQLKDDGEGNRNGENVQLDLESSEVRNSNSIQTNMARSLTKQTLV